MTCTAILTNTAGVLTGNKCHNACYKETHFCNEHQSITPQEHKSLWIRKYILGADGKPFLYTYDETKKERILRDLLDKRIVLTRQDISNIPPRDRYIDIYILLMDYGYIRLEEDANPPLHRTCYRYISDFYFFAEANRLMTLPPLAKKIREVLILKNVTHFSNYLSRLSNIQYFRDFPEEFTEERLKPIAAFLENLLNSAVAKTFIWEPLHANILQDFEEALGKEHLLTVYMREIFLHKCKELYRAEKKKQKDRTDIFKEELMMVCWHPDRFVDYCLDEEEKAEFKSLPNEEIAMEM